MPWWDSNLIDWFGQASDFKVATWPLPSGARIDAKFKFIGGTPPCASRASRYLFSWNPTGGGQRFYALINVVPSGDPFVLVGETGQDPNGWNLEFSVTDFQVGNPHPEYSELGIEFKFKLSHPGKTDWQAEWFFPEIVDGGIGPAPVSITRVGQNPTPARTRNDPCGVDTAWLGINCSPIEWYTFSECVDPLGQEMVFSQNFARFNGDDAYIALTESVSAFNAPFVVECDIRFQEFITWMPIWGNHDAGGFFGMDQSDFIFGSLREDTTWEPELNVWYHWRMEFEQAFQLRFELFIDTGEVMSVTRSRQQMSANRLGVYREGGLGVIWGGFDLKHLWYAKGTPGDFDVQLDMPLQINALDSGPFANHGTTFNMELPSV